LQKIGTMAYKLELPSASWVHPIFHVSCLKKFIGDKLPVQTILPELDEEGKIISEPEGVTKQELDSYKINQFRSISSTGRTYPLKIPHGRMQILYRSIQNYSSIEDNTFLKDRGMLLLLLIPYCPHIVINVPHRSPPLLLLCPYIIIVMSALIILWPLRLLYIERRFSHLYHPRIFPLCNVKEIAPSKRLIFKSLIYIFYLFVS